MPSKTPSIRTFFQSEVPSFPTTNTAPPIDPEAGDGFTTTEIQAVLQPTLNKWQPRHEYRTVDICDLISGPGYMTVQGRIVNLHEQVFSSKSVHAARGCLSLIVKDDTGAFKVKLHFARVNYGLRLGHLVSIWMPHVSSASSINSQAVLGTSLVTSIFPERDRTCYLMIQDEAGRSNLCRTSAVNGNGTPPMPDLITLRGYIDGGHEVDMAKVLVCVKSIGKGKSFTNKKGTPSEKIEVQIFDDTADASFVLWGSVGISATFWRPYHTILLLSYTGFYGSSYRPSLSSNQDTHVEIDPPIADAFWLRGYADQLNKHDHVNQSIPDGLFDIEEAAAAENRILFTLADIDEFVRAAPKDRFIGYLSLTLLDINIFSLHQREKLLCSECSCGVPLYANSTSARCKHCDRESHSLRINPRIMGMLIDETGNITSGRLLWSDDAWWQLLGRTKEELVSSSEELLKYLEHRLLFLKVWVMFGWAPEIGKLVVLKVGIA